MSKPNGFSNYLSLLGRKGGRSKSPAKIAAARRNAAKAAKARKLKP